MVSPTVSTITHTSPQTISITHQPLPAPSSSSDLTVFTTHTAISPGTELLIYNNLHPPNFPLDSTIPSQKPPPIYPTPSGYCAVGTLQHPPKNSPFHHNQPVFCFHPHASHFHTPPENIYPIPTGISPQNAVFLPNVETALSLIMDAAILPGETVCVVGQGIVGLLVVSLLNRLHPWCKTIALDISPSRRQISQKYANPTAILNPNSPTFHPDFSKANANHPGADVTIEVSGAANGLQTAICCTRDYGRVVIGSWYGTKGVEIGCLGGRFHRSHMQLVASQVSEIPMPLRGRWNKERRFKLAWDLLRDIQPADSFPVHTVPVAHAADAFQGVAQGRYLQVIFEYSKTGHELEE